MESAFQFTNPTLKELSFCINENFDNQSNHKVQVKMEMSTHIFKSSKPNEASVSLTVEIGEKSEKNPYWIKGTEQANFRWEDEVSEDMSERLLKQNAPSLLLSYLRPIIAQVTASSSYDAYNIPFINFAENK